MMLGQVFGGIALQTLQLVCCESTLRNKQGTDPPNLSELEQNGLKCHIVTRSLVFQNPGYFFNPQAVANVALLASLAAV